MKGKKKPTDGMLIFVMDINKNTCQFFFITMYLTEQIFHLQNG